MTHRPAIRVILAASIVALSGCGSLLRSDAPATQAWALDAPTVAAPAAASNAGTLRVLRPLAAPGIDDERIAFRRADRSMDYYATDRWPGHVPQLVQALVLDTLRAAGSYRAVQPDGAPFGYDEALQIEVRDFQAEYGSAAAPAVKVALVCTLGRRSDQRVLATFTLEGSATASENRMRAIVAAFDAAVNAALGSLPARLAAVQRQP